MMPTLARFRGASRTARHPSEGEGSSAPFRCWGSTPRASIGEFLGFALLACFVALGVGACQDAPTHPPLVDTCPGDGICRPILVVRTRATGDDEEPSKPPPNVPPSGPDIITGRVREVVDDLFLSSIAFQGRAEILAKGLQSERVVATFAGSSPFVLQNFAPEDPLWLLVRPSPNLGVLPTLSPLPLSAAFSPVELSVVRQENVDVVFQLTSVFSQRLQGYAQLILAFTDAASGDGVAGVEVELPGAEFVSYANGGAWSDLDVATDQSGVVMLANIWAPDFPGSDARVHLRGAADGDLDVRLVRDAVTLAEVPLE